MAQSTFRSTCWPPVLKSYDTLFSENYLFGFVAMNLLTSAHPWPTNIMSPGYFQGITLWIKQSENLPSFSPAPAPPHSSKPLPRGGSAAQCPALLLSVAYYCIWDSKWDVINNPADNHTVPVLTHGTEGKGWLFFSVHWLRQIGTGLHTPHQGKGPHHAERARTRRALR